MVHAAIEHLDMARYGSRHEELYARAFVDSQVNDYILPSIYPRSHCQRFCVSLKQAPKFQYREEGHNGLSRTAELGRNQPAAKFMVWRHFPISCLP